LPLLTPPERIGTVVGARYELLQAVGEGASAVLYAARDRVLGREVGVKVMRSTGPLAREEQRGRFRREAQTLARLRHPHLVEVFDVGETDDGMPFVVVELLQGETLATRLERAPQLTPAETLAIAFPLMGALACAHEAGIIHRDIKPANIFLYRRGSGAPVPKLLDFGIAKLSDQSATMTDDGMTLGTPSFMAPEQARGEALTAATDVWALGVTLYVCLSGRLPFDAPTAAGVLMQAMKHGAPRLQVPGLDSGVALAVERALAVEPARRTADMRALARSLVCTARRAGIALPADPEPVGLPDYRSWLSLAASEEGTDELPSIQRSSQAPVPAAPGALAPSVPPRTTAAADSSSALHAVRLSQARRTLRLSLGLALIVGLAAAGLVLARQAPPQASSVPSSHQEERLENQVAAPASAAPVVAAPLETATDAAMAPLAPSPTPAAPVEARTSTVRPRKAVRKARLEPPPPAVPAPTTPARPTLKNWDW
jgi:serine/threonine protein kinase